jgi:hypothetical protein
VAPDAADQTCPFQGGEAGTTPFPIACMNRNPKFPQIIKKTREPIARPPVVASTATRHCQERHRQIHVRNFTFEPQPDEVLISHRIHTREQRGRTLPPLLRPVMFRRGQLCRIESLGDKLDAITSQPFTVGIKRAMSQPRRFVMGQQLVNRGNAAKKKGLRQASSREEDAM